MLRCRAEESPNAERHSRWRAAPSGAWANQTARVRKSAERSDRPVRRSLSAATTCSSCGMAALACERSSLAWLGCWGALTNHARNPHHR